MIWRRTDRRSSTRGGLIASTVAHTVLLLLLGLFAGRQARLVSDADELTEITYIEAHYGEDVAAKVKLKALARRSLLEKPAGPGIATESAFKPQTVTPEPARPAARPAMAEAPAPSVEPAAKPQLLATPAPLDGKAYQQDQKITVDSAASRRGAVVPVTDAPSPRAPVAADAVAFSPPAANLQSRRGKLVIVDEPLPAGSAAAAASIGDVAGDLGGGDLDQARSRQTLVATLLPAAGEGSGPAGAGGRGVLDVDGPSGTGGSETGGRRTILDYGSGGGGRGASLAGTGQRLTPALDSRAIVAQEQADVDGDIANVAEVQPAGQGVSMSITGQIQGRQILRSAAPTYPEQARRRGWEGVVAVHFTVLADGRVKDNMYLEQGSVHRDLNRSAMDALKQFRFAPLPPDRAAVEQWGVITIIFRLR